MLLFSLDFPSRLDVALPTSILVGLRIRSRVERASSAHEVIPCSVTMVRSSPGESAHSLASATSVVTVHTSGDCKGRD